MTYIILETQTTNGVTAIVPPLTYTDRNEAESKFHQILASAATSNIEEHTAIILTNDGRLVRPSECYRHMSQSTPEEVIEDEENN